MSGLAELAFASGNYRQAGHYLRECLIIAEEENNCWQPVPDLKDIDDLAEALRDCPTAQAHFDEAIKSALDWQFQAQVLDPLIRLAELLAKDNSDRVAAKLKVTPQPVTVSKRLSNSLTISSSL